MGGFKIQIKIKGSKYGTCHPKGVKQKSKSFALRGRGESPRGAHALYDKGIHIYIYILGYAYM